MCVNDNNDKVRGYVYGLPTRYMKRYGELSFFEYEFMIKVFLGDLKTINSSLSRCALPI